MFVHPAKITDVVHSGSFVYQRDPKTRLVTSYRAADGFEIGTDSSFKDARERTDVFEAIYNGDLF